MTTYLLVHGAFRGGWAWDRVVPLLREAGHEVLAPTLSSDATSLDAWVDELAASTGERSVVAVGHSMGGVVVGALAARCPDLVDHLVFLDAPDPAPGERAVDHGPGAPTLPPRDLVMSPRPVAPRGDLDAATAAWMNHRLLPTPVAPSLDPMPTGGQGVPRTHAFCAHTPPGYPCETTRGRLEGRGETYVVLDAGHDAPLTAPTLVADLLLAVVVAA